MFKSFLTAEAKEIVPGFIARFLHTSTQTFALFEIKKGAILPEHAHVHEQISNVLEGQFELTIDGEKKVCNPGDMAVISSNIPHSGIAITDCKILDIFTPVREDYK